MGLIGRLWINPISVLSHWIRGIVTSLLKSSTNRLIFVPTYTRRGSQNGAQVYNQCRMAMGRETFGHINVGKCQGSGLTKCCRQLTFAGLMDTALS